MAGVQQRLNLIVLILSARDPHPVQEREYSSSPLQPSHQSVADQITTVWSSGAEDSPYSIVQLCGDEIWAKRAIASTACTRVGRSLYFMSACILSPNPHELTFLRRRWERQALVYELSKLTR